MLDLVYTNSPDGYKAMPRPHLGHSDHLSVMLVPAYKPLLKRSRPVKKKQKKNRPGLRGQNQQFKTV